jgi:hypothetical protein
VRTHGQDLRRVVATLRPWPTNRRDPADAGRALPVGGCSQVRSLALRPEEDEGFDRVTVC